MIVLYDKINKTFVVTFVVVGVHIYPSVTEIHRSLTFDYQRFSSPISERKIENLNFSSKVYYVFLY